MVTSSAIRHETPLVASRDNAKRRERLFFTGLAVVLLLTVLLGFARTFYLRQSFGSPELTSPLFAHGVAFTTWMVLLVAQTSLIAANKVAWHRRLGVAGAVLGVLMMVLGGYVALHPRAGAVMPPGVPLGLLLAVPFGAIVVFPVLLGAALLLRRRADYHKRLVMLATLELVTAAIARIPGLSAGGPLVFFGATDLFIVAIAIYDWKTRGRIHPATLWGGVFLILSQPLRVAIGITPLLPWLAGWTT
jgi:hypothetical protein